MSDLRKNLDEMMDLYRAIKTEVRRRDKHLYERWKAGGFLIDNDIISMYPAIEEVVDDLDPDDFGDDEDYEDEEEYVEHPDDEEEECEHSNAVLSDDDEPATYHCPDCGENFIGGEDEG